MATNLKKNKLVKALCYRIFAMGAFVVLIVSTITGWDALKAFFKESFYLVTGNVYYLPEFREYIHDIYTDALLGYAGVGDDNGYPLTTPNAQSISLQAKSSFLEKVKYSTDILYYIEINGKIQTNFDCPVFSEYDGHLLLSENMELCYYWDGPENTHIYLVPSNALLFGKDTTLYSLPDSAYQPNMKTSRQIRLVLAIKTSSDYDNTAMKHFLYQAKEYQMLLLTILISGICLCICLVLSLFSKNAAAEAKIAYAGYSIKLLSEVKLLIAGIVVYLLYLKDFNIQAFSNNYSSYHFSGLFLFFLAGCITYLLYIDFKTNNRKLLYRSLLTMGLLYAKEYVDGRPWYRKVMNMSASMLIGGIVSLVSGACLLFLNILSFELTAAPVSSHEVLILLSDIFCVVLLLTGILLLYMYFRARRFARDTKAVAQKLSSLQLGALNTPLILSKKSLLTQTAEDINKLESSIENAVEQNDRSNRMRVELITNVSHDLKTPLTSIINYADLICEEPLPEAAAEYAAALQKKAYHLKNMVQDVFELSKATSGNLPVKKQLLDLAKLIRQTLADMDEQISASTLTFKTAITTEPIMVEADGDRLYRVFQNLFVNCIQYSLEHSRVHVQLSTDNGFVYARVKNTSKNELDFDTQEIMERFVRADASRTTEGSGLGLSIAQSFTEACGGTFSIQTDADMFIACICLPLAENAE